MSVSVNLFISIYGTINPKIVTCCMYLQTHIDEYKSEQTHQPTNTL